MKKYISLSASSLRVMALTFMLMDHLWATVVPGNIWLHYLGRLAFPIFAFQTAEGYRHTKDFKRYCKRLLVFGLISEIPFNLMLTGSPIFPFHQNVMFTLLFGLLACREMDGLLENPFGKNLLARCGKLSLIFLGSVVLFPDYGLLGVFTVLTFHLIRGIPGAWLVQLTMMIAIHVFGFEGQVIPLFGGALEIPIQGLAVLALVPIWLYNGEKGTGGKWLQYGSYLFYPGHMLLLWLYSLLA